MKMTYAGECKSGSAYDGGELGSISVVKAQGDQRRNVDANDNDASFGAYALAA